MKTFADVLVPAQSRPALVTFLLDRTWSMRTIKAATIEGFNGYLGGLQAEKDANIAFTLITFDDVSIDCIHVAVPVRDAIPLNESTFVPRGSTPLIEAATKTILAVEQSLVERTDKPRIVICIQTDGEENRSGPEYTLARLRSLIAEKQALGWEFNFMGSGIDAYDQAARYGFKTANTMSYDAADVGATRHAFAASASNASNFAAGRTASASYSTAQRTASGDKFWAGNRLNERVAPAKPKGRRAVGDIVL
jgi:hypothetical protein